MADISTGESRDFGARLLALAKAEAQTPEGRERLLANLCATLSALNGGRCLIVGPEGKVEAMREALADLAANLVLAGDRAEYIIGEIIERPPPLLLMAVR
jgi:hypothetical protein